MVVEPIVMELLCRQALFGGGQDGKADPVGGKTIVGGVGRARKECGEQGKERELHVVGLDVVVDGEEDAS